MNVDEQTIKRVINEHGDMIYRLALHYVRDRDDAEDVVQEVLLAYLLKVLDDLRAEKAWLIRVTINKSLNIIKKRNKYVIKPDVQDMLEIACTDDEDNDVLNQIRKLNEFDRKIVFLKYYEGYTSDEIGKMVHRSGSLIRKRLMKIKETLKGFFEEG